MEDKQHQDSEAELTDLNKYDERHQKGEWPIRANMADIDDCQQTKITNSDDHWLLESSGNDPIWIWLIEQPWRRWWKMAATDRCMIDQRAQLRWGATTSASNCPTRSYGKVPVERRLLTIAVVISNPESGRPIGTAWSGKSSTVCDEVQRTIHNNKSWSEAETSTTSGFGGTNGNGWHKKTTTASPRAHKSKWLFLRRPKRDPKAGSAYQTTRQKLLR